MRALKRGRPTMLIGVFLAGMIVAAGLTWKLDLWSRASATSNPSACGTVTIAGASWLDGQGVDVHSNGDNQGTGISCAYNDQPVYDLYAKPAIYGYGWQCVELVTRLYASRGWFPRLWLGTDTNFGAKWLYTYAERGKYDGLTAHANGSGYQPVPGDLIVHSNGTYGHVSVVDRIDGATLHAVEQNNSASGWAEYSFDPGTGAVSKSGATISGYVHAAKNTATSVGTSPSPLAPQLEHVSLRVTGSCTSAGGELTSQSTGFSPGGEISISAWYADGRAYTNLKTSAIARADGSVPWRWPCKGDPSGMYGTRLVDLSTGRHVDAYFTIGPSPQASTVRSATPPSSVLPPPPPPQQPPPPPQQPPPPPQQPASSPPPKPTASNLVVVIYGGGHVGVAFDVGWQTGRDPITCHFFIDGHEVASPQCGTHSSKQFYGISPGQHSFHAIVSDQFGVYSDPTPTIVKNVT